MKVTIEIPDEFTTSLFSPGQEPARNILEALALEAYRNDSLGEAEIRRLLGFETRMEVHGFLKEHDAFLPYTAEDLEHDWKVAREVAERAQRQLDREATGILRAG